MLNLYKFISGTVYNLSLMFNKRKAENGDQLWKGRLGIIDKPDKIDIWIHAASVGEIKVIGHLIKALLKKSPEMKIYLTAMTKTGYKTAVDNYSLKVNHFGYFPIDHSKAVNKTLDIVKPSLIVIAETEIWPNLVESASIRNIPIVIVNGRMSAKAYGRYRKLKKTFSNILKLYNRIFVKTQQDAERYSYFSISDLVEIVGDMKFDAEIFIRSEEEHIKICNRFNISSNKKWFVAGSTRPGEEEQIINSYKKLKNDFPDSGLMLAPRHLERLDDVIKILISNDLSFEKLSQCNPDCEVILVDQMGQLNDLYKIAEISFVGGTLTDIGGHNLLEPIYNGSPVLYGSSVFNVLEADEHIRMNNYGYQVKDSNELTIQLINYYKKDIIYNIKDKNNILDSATTKTSNYILKLLNEI